MSSPFVIIYGGSGALGSVAVRLFKQRMYQVINIDLSSNASADHSIAVPSNFETLSEQSTYISDKVSGILNNNKVDAIVCVAGGWQGGNAASKDFIGSADKSIKQSVNTSLIAASLAARYLSPTGLLVLAGAAPALKGTPGMIGYGMAKAAVHHLVTSLAMPGSGVDGRVVGILPVTLDTKENRSAMPNADFTTWTPLETVVERIFTWLSTPAECESGKLYSIITENSVTKFE
ncbi:hypothetical protein IWW39_002646 [Coemansia spiralis]|uniref:Dihydropteridine reductase n=1 Tax=Coemansia spiralis TaxID=417178 RepID=A0A9W8GGH0_9FUNG|nr:hypothetical protein IWW39_002646 [Coemansia spiralis]